MFNKQTHLSSIATRAPRSISVLKKYRLDFCCGGQRPIAEACAEKRLDADLVLKEILTLANAPSDSPASGKTWEEASCEDLIHHILVRFHERHRQDLVTLIPLARKVEGVHAEKELVPHGLTDLLTEVAAAMEDHMAKEENILFPWILRGESIPPREPVRVMMEEHLGHKEKLLQLRKTCRDFALPEDACPTWRALYAGVEQLIDDLMEHIHLENNVLFPRALQ